MKNKEVKYHLFVMDSKGEYQKKATIIQNDKSVKSALKKKINIAKTEKVYNHGS